MEKDDSNCHSIRNLSKSSRAVDIWSTSVDTHLDKRDRQSWTADYLKDDLQMICRWFLNEMTFFLLFTIGEFCCIRRPSSFRQLMAPRSFDPDKLDRVLVVQAIIFNRLREKIEHSWAPKSIRRSISRNQLHTRWPCEFVFPYFWN